MKKSLHLHYPGWGPEQRQIPVIVNKSLVEEPNPDLLSSKASVILRQKRIFIGDM
jgi:hypothetical protein